MIRDEAADAIYDVLSFAMGAAFMLSVTLGLLAIVWLGGIHLYLETVRLLG